jgi:uncharacterized protein YwqG
MMIFQSDSCNRLNSCWCDSGFLNFYIKKNDFLQNLKDMQWTKHITSSFDSS